MDNEKTVKKFEEPEIEVIHITETDIITTSGELWDGEDKEGEIILH